MLYTLNSGFCLYMIYRRQISTTALQRFNTSIQTVETCAIALEVLGLVPSNFKLKVISLVLVKERGRGCHKKLSLFCTLDGKAKLVEATGQFRKAYFILNSCSKKKHRGENRESAT